MIFEITKENVKFIGRTCYDKGVLWCGLSGSGIEFTFTGTKANITLIRDDTTHGVVTEGKARVGIDTDGVRVVDTLLEEPEKTFCVFESGKARTVTIRILKLSECAMSTAGIKSLDIEGTEQIFPTPLRTRRIEFIGDSITCGYGVDLEEPESGFLTSTEDVTKTYAFETAMELDADYSMVSFSGYGVLSGYSDTDKKDTRQLVPNYYDKVGFSYAKPWGTLSLADISWDFNEFKPDLAVINLGTNDDSYCKDYRERQEEFAAAYKKFLEEIRRHNPQAILLCTVGIMGGRIYPAVEEGVRSYRTATGDTAVYTMKFAEQLPEDGYVTNYHPTKATHKKAALALTEKIREIMNWPAE